jgi:hypothetical protein
MRETSTSTGAVASTKTVETVEASTTVATASTTIGTSA